MIAALNRNLRLYPWYLASTWEGISNAVWFLYLFSYKGLTLSEMGWLVLLGDGVIVLSEVPTGWLADKMGRRFSIITGIILQALSAVLFIFGDSFAAFWLAMAVCGLGDTFRSGADEALLYDSCLATGRRQRYRPLLAHSMFVATIVMVISQISGGIIATKLSWELPFWLEIGFSAAGFIAVWQMVEPPRQTQDSIPAGQPGLTSNAGRAKPAAVPSHALWWRLAPLLAFASIIEAFPELAHFHLPAELANDLGFTPLHLGFVYAAFELMQGLGNKLAGSKRFTQPLKVLPWIACGLAACFALFGLRAWLGLIVYLIARTGIDFLYGLAAPLISEETNRRTTSDVRATALSVVNAGRRIIPLGLLPLSAGIATGSSFESAHLLMLAGLAVPLIAVIVWLKRERKRFATLAT